MHPFLTKNGDEYLVKGVSQYSEEEYKRLMSQVNAKSQDPLKPPLNEDVEQLVIKARESALLAIDIYNRPATSFKSEGFIVIMIIAWTSLLHAIFRRDNIKYSYLEKDGSDRKTKNGALWYWELETCVTKYFQGKEKAITSNLLFMVEIRHKIEHRFVPKIDNHIAGECQSLILNFDELLVKEFTDYYALRDLLTFPLQTSNLNSGGRIEAVKKFQGKNYVELKQFIETYRKGLADDVYNDPKFSFQVYLIPKVGDKLNSSDMSMEFIKYDPTNPESLKEVAHLITAIKEKRIKTGNPDGMKPKEVARKVAEKIGKKFTTNYHTRAWKYYKARPSGSQKGFQNEYCYFDSAHNDYVYTPIWSKFLIENLVTKRSSNGYSLTNTNAMIVLKNTARDWLIQSGYAEAAALIDVVMNDWKATGNKQRRNWWDVLAGDQYGKSRIIAGKIFPVFRAAQIRKGRPVTPNAIFSELEKPLLPIRQSKNSC